MAVSGSKGNTTASNSLLHRNQGLLTFRVGSTDQEEQPRRIKAPAPATLRVSMHRSMLGDGLWSRLKSSASGGHLPARSAPGTCGDAPADHVGCRPPATPRRHGATPVRPLDPKRSPGGLPHRRHCAGQASLSWDGSRASAGCICTHSTVIHGPGFWQMDFRKNFSGFGQSLSLGISRSIANRQSCRHGNLDSTSSPHRLPWLEMSTAPGSEVIRHAFWKMNK